MIFNLMKPRQDLYVELDHRYSSIFQFESSPFTCFKFHPQTDILQDDYCKIPKTLDIVIKSPTIEKKSNKTNKWMIYLS